MKATGIVRAIDNLGRIVIPKELRLTLGLVAGESVEIFTEDDKVIFKKYCPSCIFCSEASDIVSYKSNNLCRKCYNKMTK